MRAPCSSPRSLSAFTTSFTPFLLFRHCFLLHDSQSMAPSTFVLKFKVIPSIPRSCLTPVSPLTYVPCSVFRVTSHFHHSPSFPVCSPRAAIFFSAVVRDRRSPLPRFNQDTDSLTRTWKVCTKVRVLLHGPDARQPYSIFLSGCRSSRTGSVDPHVFANHIPIISKFANRPEAREPILAMLVLTLPYG